MSENGSEWAPPTESQPKTPKELLEAHYADRENPDDMDNMVVLPGEQPGMIEVPDWVKQGGRPEPGDPGYEAGFDDNPFAKDKEVIVKRNGKNGQPDYNEGGWKIIDDDATVKIGKDKYMVGVVVEKEIDGEVFQKSIPLNELMELNPRAEKEPLTEQQEELADEAIEEAIGLEDPSEVDEDTHNYTPDDIKRMREAARRVVNSENPVIPNLAEMMSGESAPQAPTIPNLNKMMSGEQGEEDPAVAMLKDFDEDDRMLLKSYALAIADQREAHAAAHAGGDVRPGASQEAAQNAAWALKQLSPKAKEIANRFAQVYPGK